MPEIIILSGGGWNEYDERYKDASVEELSPYVRALHVSDNDGTVDNNQPFDRGAWFVQHLAKFPRLPCVIETEPLDPSTLAACVSIVENAR